MTFTEQTKAELAKPLERSHIKPPKKFGPKGHYIEGWLAIAEANRIFGFDGWSYTIDLIKDDVTLGKDKDGNDQWQAAYSCICTVEAGGVTRQDVGFGSGFAKMIGDAIEGATKEAVTDALKRCLRTFGHPFGLALYDKDRANVSDAAPVEPVKLSDANVALITTLAQAASVTLQAITKRYSVQKLEDISAEDFPALIESLNLTIEQKKVKAPA